ncbi:hypothetical protein NHX12_019335 [Muraenolepis orangiensis]|uniref:Uncharacterized protein n=1 Tax=Muraenolepis orangiensis TaxID=630683 RepID=A0A9Q0ET63_9TELE|nr:hypothetical protein NHX12_019335 [Muraenolepis orangiensis]
MRSRPAVSRRLVLCGADVCFGLYQRLACGPQSIACGPQSIAWPAATEHRLASGHRASPGQRPQSIVWPAATEHRLASGHRASSGQRPQSIAWPAATEHRLASGNRASPGQRPQSTDPPPLRFLGLCRELRKATHVTSSAYVQPQLLQKSNGHVAEGTSARRQTAATLKGHKDVAERTGQRNGTQGCLPNRSEAWKRNHKKEENPHKLGSIEQVE